MKKSIVYCLFALATLTVVSCGKKDKNETTTETTTEINHKENQEHAVMYQCPMDCENGKTYDAAGVCPVCEMDLAVMESHDGHDH